jgi:hypothetical protein
MKKLVCIESPWRNFALARPYLSACIRDAVMRGEVPIASHAMFCVASDFNDEVDADRALGLTAARVMIQNCQLVAVYCDHGISEGMRRAMEFAFSINKPVETRRIGL